MKILLFGKNGQIGKHIYDLIKNKYQTKALDKRQCNFLNSKIIKQQISSFKPDVIINAVAFTKVDLAESKKNICIKINSHAVRDLAKIAKKNNSFLIHFSTDYIFDGKKNKPYKEIDRTNPLSFYGKSKLLGELNLKKYNKKHVILRTSWVFSNYNSNFFNNILNLMKSKKRLTIVSDQFGTPTSASILSKMTLLIIKKYQKNFKAKFPYGTYNVVSKGYTSWHGFSQKILDCYNFINKKKINVVLDPISSKEYNSAAKRPKYSVLNGYNFERKFNVKMPLWDEQVYNVMIEHNNKI